MVRPRLPAPGLLAAFLVLAAPAPGPQAATRTVTDCGDSGQPGQLRQAISAAGPGDVVQLPACTIVLTGAPGEDANAGGDLDVAGSLTIRGRGRSATVLDGDAVDRVLHVLAGAIVVVEDLTVRNGFLAAGDGAGILNEGTLTLARVTVTGNRALSDEGGGIAGTAGASLTATDVEVSNNSAHGGGGILSRGLLTLRRLRIVGNRGGGLHVVGSPAPAIVADTTIAANLDQGGGGGGVVFRGDATGAIVRSTITGNVLLNGAGGGVLVDGAGTILRIDNTTIAHNIATSDGGGGGIHIDAGTVTLVHATVTLNTDTEGRATSTGGINKSAGILHLVNSIVALNFAAGGFNDVDPAAVDSQTNSRVGGDPRLGPLQDNGGPTFTMLPFPGGEVIDEGRNEAADVAGVTTDQRGVPRPLDGNGNGAAFVDIGAVELEPAPGGLLVISPASGPYLAARPLDVVLFLEAPGRSLDPAASQASLDAADVTPALARCLAPGPVPDGGRAFRCPALAGGSGAARTGLGPGLHTLAVTLSFIDGSTARATATWSVRATD
jgi:hypothetical protein